MIIYLDENMPKHLAHGFHTIQKPENLKTGIDVEVLSLPENLYYSIKDKDWIPLLGKEGSCIITQDINISRKKNELTLFKKHNVGMFILRGPSKKQGLSIWEMTQALAKNWSKICQIATTEKKPFGYTFTLKGRMKKVI